MALSVEAVEMLIERLTNVEISQERLYNTIRPANYMKGVCPCWVLKIDFYESGAVKSLVTGNPKFTCRQCYPKGHPYAGNANL